MRLCISSIVIALLVRNVVGDYSSSSNDDWERVGNVISGLLKKDQQGPVAISNNGWRIAVGAPHWKKGSSKGMTRVYQYELELEEWTQMGQNIKGNDKGNRLGQSLTLSNDGTTLAVGVPFDSSIKKHAGSVQIHQYNNSTNEWMDRGILQSNGKRDTFGYSVSLSDNGNWLLIGAPNIGGGGSDGYISLYEYNSVNNSYQVVIDHFSESSTEEYGHSVDMNTDGTVLAVHAKASGDVFMYNVVNDALIPRSTIAFDSTNGSMSLSYNGNLLAIGAPLKSSGKGKVQVHEYNHSTDSWTQIGSTIVGSNNKSNEGSVVDLVVTDSDMYLVTTAPGDAIVKTYLLDTDKQEWIPRGTDISAATGFEDGTYVAFSQNGSMLAVGAPLDGTNRNGEATVYQWCHAPSESPSTSPSQSQTPSLTPSVYQCQSYWDPIFELDGDGIGPVAISYDGTVLAVGSVATGDTTVYEYNTNNHQWDVLGTTISSSSSESLQAVALTTQGLEYTLALGYPFSDNETGTLLLYTFTNGDWISVTTGDNGELVENQQFGSSLAFSADGMSLLVGAPGSGSSTTGNVVVYTRIVNFGWFQTHQIQGTIQGFGSTVATTDTGQTIAIGSPKEGTAKQGAVHVYTYTNTGLELLGPILLGTKKKDEFGTSVAIQENSSGQLILAVGSPKAKRNSMKKSGTVSVYEWNQSNNQWMQRGADIVGSKKKALAGTSLDLSHDGSTVVVGEVGSGTTVVYTYHTSKWIQEGNTIQDSTPHYLSMSTDGTSFAIGSPTSANDNGTVTVYKWCNDYNT